MNKTYLSALIFSSIIFLTSCASDLSNSTYTTASTFNLTLEGKIVSVRPIIIKKNDSTQKNIIGGVAGGALAASAVNNGNNPATTIGAGLAGAALGSIIEDKLTTQHGYEYIIKANIDNIKRVNTYNAPQMIQNTLAAAITSGFITIVQSDKTPIAMHSNVYVTISDDRARVIPAN